MKKFLLTIVCLVGCLAARGETYKYLTFQKVDGSTQSIGVEALELSYTDGNVEASNGTSSLMINLAELAKMYFTNENSGVEAVKFAAENVVEVYTAAGVKLGEYKSATQAAVNLPKGVYLFKSQGVTQKVSVR